MRVNDHIHLRHVMLHHFKKGWTAIQSRRHLDETYGDGTICKSQCEEWFRRFKSGDLSLEDEKGRGHPSDFDDQALLEAVEVDQSLRTRMLADQFNVSHVCIVKPLKKLGEVWKLAGWVPDKLSDQKRQDQKSPDN